MDFFEIVDDLLLTNESTISRFHCNNQRKYASTFGQKLETCYHVYIINKTKDQLWPLSADRDVGEEGLGG